MTDLSQLIERVEAATGPDRKIDAAICRLVDLPKCQFPDCLPDVLTRLIERVEGGGEDPDIPRYTGSIDAALTLLPEGWTYQVSNRAPRPNTGRAYLHNGELIYAGLGFRKNPKFQSAEVVAATPALALCTAILKARQTAAQPAKQAEAR